MKIVSKSNDIGLKSLFEGLVNPILETVADKDSRRSNAKHSALDALKAGFAIFHLKAPSLFSFRPRLETEEQNLKSIFQIDQIPSDNGLRDILDGLPADKLNEGFNRVLPFLESHGQLAPYQYWNGHLICSIDGVQHQCSNKVKCDYCLVRKHRNGSESYAHSMLTAAVVCPGLREVFVVNNEPIVKQDGETKNDCERNAAKRLFTRLSDTFADKPVVYVLDALYACAPVVNQIIGQGPGAKYVINAKEKGNKHLFSQFDTMNEAGEIKWVKKRVKDGLYHLGYANDLSINKANEGVKCNLLYCSYKPKNGKEVVFSWVTNIELNALSVMSVMRMGRSRWKIENEVFNTLKNQEYNYGHNFGHGKKNLATNFAYLMMLAFTVDQIRQLCSRTFQRVYKVLDTRVKIWEMYRSIFKLITCENAVDFECKLLEMCGLRVT
jgi:hypothetical protein